MRQSKKTHLSNRPCFRCAHLRPNLVKRYFKYGNAYRCIKKKKEIPAFVPLDFAEECLTNGNFLHGVPFGLVEKPRMKHHRLPDGKLVEC